MILLSLCLVLSMALNLRSTIKLHHPNGILQVDEYQNKDTYNIIILDPLDEMKERKRIILEVRYQKHPFAKRYDEDDPEYSEHMKDFA